MISEEMTVGEYFKDGRSCEDCIFDQEGICPKYQRGGPNSFCINLDSDDLIVDLI